MQLNYNEKFNFRKTASSTDRLTEANVKYVVVYIVQGKCGRVRTCGW